MTNNEFRGRFLKHTSNLLAVAALAVAYGHVQRAHAMDPAALISYRDTFTREMCRGGATWLKCFLLEPAQCVTLTSPIVEGCARTTVQNTAKLSVSGVTVESASDTIIQCVERSFRQRYESKKLNTQECKNF